MRILPGAGAYVASTDSYWAEHLNVPDLSCGTYSLPAGGADPQTPHTEDEIYLVTQGRATLWTPEGSAQLKPGDVAFVAAGEEHRFVDIVEDFAALVIFGPAEYSRAADPSEGSGSGVGEGDRRIDPHHAADAQRGRDQTDGDG